MINLVTIDEKQALLNRELELLSKAVEADIEEHRANRGQYWSGTQKFFEYYRQIQEPENLSRFETIFSDFKLFTQWVERSLELMEQHPKPSRIFDLYDELYSKIKLTKKQEKEYAPIALKLYKLIDQYGYSQWKTKVTGICIKYNFEQIKNIDLNKRGRNDNDIAQFEWLIAAKVDPNILNISGLDQKLNIEARTEEQYDFFIKHGWGPTISESLKQKLKAKISDVGSQIDQTVKQWDSINEQEAKLLTSLLNKEIKNGKTENAIALLQGIRNICKAKKIDPTAKIDWGTINKFENTGLILMFYRLLDYMEQNMDIQLDSDLVTYFVKNMRDSSTKFKLIIKLYANKQITI